ncbi:MAG TPA: sporulation integral membrane protein YlbJ [Clostridia bacterium]|nr:sporulation integral membrane protein YlbJ [Clostridia bacterium]
MILRKLVLPFLCILFVLCLILFSGSAVKAAQNGLALWAGVVVPSLFPFFVASEIINSTGFIRTSGVLLEPVMRPVFNVPGSASFALLLGITSGYPVGAKITSDLRNGGLLSRTEAERLLAFTNNSGPLFIVGAVGTGMYGSPRIGIFLLACHILACLTVGVLFRFYGRSGGSRIKESRKKDLLKTFKTNLLSQQSQAGGFGSILGNAIRNSVATILAIGGFIVLFAVIIQLLTETGLIGALAGALSFVLSPLGLDRDVLTGVISGVFEITTGSRIASALASVPVTVKLPAVSLIIGWAGLSVHFQVMSITSVTDIRVMPYFFGKALQGIIAAIYTAAGIKLLQLETLAISPVLSSYGTGISGFWGLFARSFIILSVLLIFFVICQRTAGKAKTVRTVRR